MSDTRDRDPSPLDLRSVFLGPKGENADVFERLLLEAFRDHVFWRRNFHPEDGFGVSESERHRPAYEESVHRLSQELLGLLGELKAGVPFFSPRYLGHMCADLTMASLIGYFAAMLYNPNNVSVEASPVTTRLELEVARQLARMIGYDPERQWGHLTSGGTLANLEALWAAHNSRYLPVAIRWTAEDLGVRGVGVELPDGTSADLAELDLWRLLNVTPSAALDLAEGFVAALGGSGELHDIIAAHSLEGLGTQRFGRRLAREFGDILEPAVVLVPSTAHYSWEKSCRALGLGSAQLVHVPVDRRYRMDTEALRETVHRLARRHQPVLAAVAVLGTTEEGAVDRLDRIVELREEVGRDHGVAFHLHADAAWGGYALSVLWDGEGRQRSHRAVLDDQAPEPWPSEAVYKALAAARHTDSVTIDPHKLGFVPYPAGAISFRDRRVRDLVALEAPYVFHQGATEAASIGRFILEGSKPGAAAAGVWLSHQVLPLDARGYGRLVGQTARGALALWRRLDTGDWEPFVLHPLPGPDLNLVCFAVGHPALETLEETNAFVARIHEALSVSGGLREVRPPYFVTRTTLRADEYGDAAIPVAEALGFTADDYRRVGGVAVVRSTVMDPFLAEARDPDTIEGFVAELRRVMDGALET